MTEQRTTPAGGMRITIERRLAPDVTEQFLVIHRDAFAPFDELSAVRQSLTDDEFRDEMAHPSILKFLGVDQAGHPSALALLTNDLTQVPWINERFYAARYPDHYERRSIFYFFTLLVAPEAQGGPWVTAMIEALSMHTALAKGMVAFDCCQFNVTEMKVPDLIKGIGERFVQLDCREIDTQRYYTYEVLGLAEIDLRDTKDHGVDIDLTLPPEPAPSPVTADDRAEGHSPR